MIIPKHIHMVGIKGAGMSALARILKARGAVITGSDVSEAFFTDELLRKEGIPVTIFSDSKIPQCDELIYSTAWETGSEVRLAREKNIRTLSYADAVAEQFNSMFGIAITGSHGKTTTSALCAYVLRGLDKDPTALIGSEMIQLKTNALAGASDYFVLEADEYQDKFLQYAAHAAIVTSIDYDHPDYFLTRLAYDEAFISFVSKVNGPCIVCADDGGIQRIWNSISSRALVAYGHERSCDYSLGKVDERTGEAEMYKKKDRIGVMRLQLVGCHNALNALAVYALCDTLKLGTPDEISRLLGEFQGTARRFEQKGIAGKTLIIDDYAHHPTEIRATLRAARARYPDSIIWCLFSPHTYSRTKELLDDFSKSFSNSDKVLVTDIFGSAREGAGDITAEQFVAKINAFSALGDFALYLGSNEQAIDYLMTHLAQTDILLTMGAGDVYKIGEQLISQTNGIIHT